MAKGDLTRDRILSKAAEQASVRGFGAVSLGDVAAAAGLSKSGVFKHFKAKEALQQALLERVFAAFSQSVWKPAEDLPQGRARLNAVFENWLDWVEGRDSVGGCGLMQAQIELDDQPGPLRDYLKSQLVLWEKTLAAEFRALRDPPLEREDAHQAAFEMTAIALGYNQSRRMLENQRARTAAVRAFAALLARFDPDRAPEPA